jgi:hypothetical protein
VCIFCHEFGVAHHDNAPSLGTVDMQTVEKVQVRVTSEEKARLERVSRRPPLDEILNLHDFEVGLVVSSCLGCLELTIGYS